ncbi:S-adenosyl-L-methionine-dependent methyltransferase [Colletotrichum navitas]|uniref:Protein arginine methyltransferase NDUFAF7 n=1 Tax=Colletotrichum navitas TaxID=681940 RepID=A0AAD8Q459_9PEZI|nr:S-adenosyl-L-methionine-dependent methyltransferase [Colletotrichum navitas]KAK1595224.1 S-adenosyl-L-methionine-dependent methyltransferase [Colletotrichum navitas]
MQRLFTRGALAAGLQRVAVTRAAVLRAVQRPLAVQASRDFSCTVSRHEGKKEGKEERKWSTPLAKQLAEAISMTGPVPLASYMRMCLTGDIDGYYTGLAEENRDQFGLKGDFVTSPEISQIFGELIGVWFVAEWLSQGKPKQGVELIEVGPGRGTLMDDMLRTIQNFKGLAQSIDAIYMVEASPQLREAQKNLLCGPDAPMTESKVGYHSVCKYTDLPIVWTETIKSIPQRPDKMPFIVAHEFFDALPIHVFQAVTVPHPSLPKNPTPDPPIPPKVEWREMLVSPTPPDATHATMKIPKSEQGDPIPDFQMTLSPGTTRHSRYLPESSSRYSRLKASVPDAVVEICPDASLYASDFASRIGGSKKHPKSRPTGAALILDYGTSDTVPINSLRGIRRHRRVSPFSEPGLVDLSADVDFTAIAEAATRASQGVEVHGPIEQGAFLELMGIRQRAEVLMKQVRGKEEFVKAEDIARACGRLIDCGPGGMGKVYKVMAILPENAGRRRPVGFGGDV